MKRDIDDINNELKLYINEATFISDSTLRKVLTLISKYFYVNLPVDNYLKVDIQIKENGNIIMKGEEYVTENKIEDINELYDRYDKLSEKIKALVDKKEVNFDKKRLKNDRNSFFITIGLILLYIAIIVFSVILIIHGIFYGIMFIFIVIIPTLTPKIREYYSGALRFIKHIFKK